MGKVTRRKKADIKQAELEELWNAQQELAELKAQVEGTLNSLTARLEDGETVEPGEYGATINETKRTSVKWKDEFKKLCEEAGKSFPVMESTVKANTEPTVTRKAKVVLLEGL